MRNLLTDKVTISYYAEDSRNNLGEPALTLTQRASSVASRLMPRKTADRSEEEQGQLQKADFVLFLSAGQTIAIHDVVTDSDSNTYTVVAVDTWESSHKEAALRRIA